MISIRIPRGGAMQKLPLQQIRQSLSSALITPNLAKSDRAFTTSSTQGLHAKHAQPEHTTTPSPSTTATKATKPSPKRTKSHAPPPPPPPQTMDALFQQRKWPLIGAGIMAMGFGLYASLMLTAYLKGGSCNTCTHPSPSTTPEEARQTAEKFDHDLALPEYLMGITGLRKTLALEARGHVLEVAMGTGRNLEYYDWTGLVAQAKGDEGQQQQVDDNAKTTTTTTIPATKAGDESDESTPLLTYTGLDISPDMMSLARTRLRDSVPGLKKLLRKQRLEPPPNDNRGVYVDTMDSRVRLTFGLCSVSDPSKLLANMASAVQPDTGRIILIEHGRGWYDWLNGLLDKYAHKHHERYGCWWNRDIEHLVREAARTTPGLEVVALKRPFLLQFGTTLLVELRVNSGLGAGDAEQKA
ncbi:hypothetical protein B0T17DRAFT_524292 [Bombardia bombarda]|uniref:S-adenosyl-L-methionine-dependent methyltransferase n=1 Tax=Bombardia bombarda TaxID=252184 RepID=A0AA40C8Z2_9PEZI|nr:hypothetical protein B0T17DRAFT_524292 [Bombardia bombarda]